MASVVAARLSLDDTTAVGCCSEPSCDAILGTVVVVFSSGYSLVTGWLVYPVTCECALLGQGHHLL